MKELKVKTGTILIFAFLLIMIIPKGSCSSSINDTVFLNPAQMTIVYSMPVSRGEIVKWSFSTYDDPFNVYAVGVGVGVMFSNGKTSDSGSIEALTTGAIGFYFTNMGPTSGYIDINIHIKKDSIFPIIIGAIVGIGVASVVGVVIYTVYRKNKIQKRSGMQQVPEPVPRQEIPQIKEPIKYCVHCGQPYRKDSKFCVKCGRNLPDF